jgi:hypothetical protein
VEARSSRGRERERARRGIKRGGIRRAKSERGRVTLSRRSVNWYIAFSSVCSSHMQLWQFLYHSSRSTKLDLPFLTKDAKLLMA